MLLLVLAACRGALKHIDAPTSSQVEVLISNETAYVNWQGSKIRENQDWVLNVDRNVERSIRARWSGLKLLGKSVLCIGARAGGEVRAFASMGAFAIGIDIAPLPGSKHVLPGDAMKLQFASGSVDFVFTNIMDHIPRLGDFAREMARVLKTGGVFFSNVHVQRRSDDEWAVRDTGTADFYRELKSAMPASMKECLRPDLGPTTRSHLIAWEKQVSPRMQVSAGDCSSDNAQAFVVLDKGGPKRNVEHAAADAFVAPAAPSEALRCGGAAVVAAASGALNPFGQNLSSAFLFPQTMASDWCIRERAVAQRAQITVLTTVAAGLSFNDFGVSFAERWVFDSPLDRSLRSTVLLTSGRRSNRLAVQHVLQEDFIDRRGKRPCTPVSPKNVANNINAACDPRKLSDLEQSGAVLMRWNLTSSLPAPSLDEMAGAEAFMKSTDALARLTGGVRLVGCADSKQAHRTRLSGHPNALPSRSSDRRAMPVWCSQLQQLVDAALPRMLPLARGYLGDNATYSGFQLLRLPGHRLSASKAWTSGMYHHDRCGRRLKCFVFWSDVTPEAHPTRIALGSHNTLYYSYDDMKESRFTDRAVEEQYNVTPMLGKRGDGFCCCTNSIHRATLTGSASRDVVILEFDRSGSAWDGCPKIH